MASEELRSICESISQNSTIMNKEQTATLHRILHGADGLRDKLYMDVSKQILATVDASDAVSLCRVLLCLWEILSSSQRSTLLKVVWNIQKRFKDGETEKFIYEAVSTLPYSYVELLSVIHSLKIAGLSTSLNGTKHRLRAILALSDGKHEAASIALVDCFSAELMLYSHDQSSVVRGLGLQILAKLCELSSGNMDNIAQLITIFTGGLAGISVDMRSGALTCIGVSIYNLWECLDNESRLKIIKTVYALSTKDSDNCQLVRSMIRFTRLVLKRLCPITRGHKLDSDQQHILKLCCTYYGHELLLSKPSKSACRIPMRRLTTKLGKKLGWDTLRKSFVPSEHWPLTRYAERFANREASQRRKMTAKYREENASSGDEEEDELVSKLHRNLGNLGSAQSPVDSKIIVSLEKTKANKEMEPRKNLSNLAELRVTREKEGRKKERQHEVVGLDPDSKRRNGDARRKGQVLEPYAYVRLNPSLSKEKHKGLAVRSFKKVLTISKRGKRRV